MWIKREDCRDVIEVAWQLGTLSATPEEVASSLQRCASALASWNQNVVGNIPKKIAEKRRILNTITSADQLGVRGAETNQLRGEINDLLDSEETIWRQRGKVHWYRDGDRNTKFFHARALERRKKNTILGLWNDDGLWCDSKESITDTDISYFKKIYTTSSPTEINEVISAIPRRVTEDMNIELTKTFTKEEAATPPQQSSRAKWYVCNLFSQLLGHCRF